MILTSTGEAILYGYEDSYFICMQQLASYLDKGFVFYKHSFSLQKTFIDWLKWCGLLVNYWYFFSAVWTFWRHPFTADDPSVSKWCNATFLQIWSDEETNSSISWVAWWQRWTVTKYIYLSAVLYLSIIFLETCYFNFTTFERQISYFLLRYIYIKVPK